MTALAKTVVVLAVFALTLRPETARAAVDKPNIVVVVDSANLLPYFLESSDQPAHAYLMHRGGKGPSYALRDGKWKLIMDLAKKHKGKKLPQLEGGRFSELLPTALYNLETNRNEDASGNLLKNPEYSERVDEMLRTYKHLRESGEPTSRKPEA